MIVRDAAAHLPICIASVAGCVDEMVVVDTGSSDGTPTVARDLGARVIDSVWADDFAGARNLGLDAVRSEWVLVLDADERFEPGEAGRPGAAGWRRWLERASADAFQVTIRNYMRSSVAHIWDREAQPNAWFHSPHAAWPEAAECPAWVEHQNVRLFRSHPALRFVGRVHESVGPRVEAAGLRLGGAQGLIHHFGLAREPEAQAEKNRFYRELGRRKAAEQPQDAQAQFELGVTEFENFHDAAAALLCFERALRLKPAFALAWLFGGMALLQMGHAAEASAFFAQARRCGYASQRLSELEGDAAYNQGDYAAAAAAYRRAQIQNAANPELSSKTGLAQVRAGNRQLGLELLRRAVARAPECAANHDRLVAALVWLGEREAAVAAQRRRVEQFPDDAAAAARLQNLCGRGADTDDGEEDGGGHRRPRKQNAGTVKAGEALGR